MIVSCALGFLKQSTVFVVGDQTFVTLKQFVDARSVGRDFLFECRISGRRTGSGRSAPDGSDCLATDLAVSSRSKTLGRALSAKYAKFCARPVSRHRANTPSAMMISSMVAKPAITRREMVQVFMVMLFQVEWMIPL